MLQMYIFYFKYVCKMVNNCKKKDIIVTKVSHPLYGGLI